MFFNIIYCIIIEVKYYEYYQYNGNRQYFMDQVIRITKEINSNILN